MKTFGKLPHTTGQGLGAGMGGKSDDGYIPALEAECHNKSDFDRKSSSAQLEGNGWI
jgi:hypothetical protein